MNPDTALLPLCVALALLGLVATVALWRSGRTARGRVLQGLAWTLVPVALYLTGLLRMVWDAVVAVAQWASRVVFSPTVWTGFSLLAVAAVLFVVGGFLVRRSHLRADPDARKVTRGGERRTPAASTTTPAVTGGQGRPAARQTPAADPVDDDLAEIEALLKKRGIQ